MCTTEIKAMKKEAIFSQYNILKPHQIYLLLIRGLIIWN